MKTGLYDGTLVSGGSAEDNVAIQLGEIDALIKGESKAAYSPVDSFKVTIDNLSDFGY